ncbi:MAG: cell division protein ZapA [Bacteroidales bacterium]|nr:cell division protein ZapA [Bacteroidales bacterium]
MAEVSTTVTILDRNYKLRISSDEEANLVKAAELIETQAKNYGKLYAYQDRQDLLAMVALTQITQLVKIQNTLKAKDSELETRLKAIDNALDTILHRT